jgi:hypothetical protein
VRRFAVASLAPFPPSVDHSNAGNRTRTDLVPNQSVALRLHHAFRRRVGSILPDRWTLSRSRIRAYADMIEQYQEVGIDAGVDREAE